MIGAHHPRPNISASFLKSVNNALPSQQRDRLFFGTQRIPARDVLYAAYGVDSL